MLARSETINQLVTPPQSPPTQIWLQSHHRTTLSEWVTAGARISVKLCWWSVRYEGLCQEISRSHRRGCGPPWGRLPGCIAAQKTITNCSAVASVRCRSTAAVIRSWRGTLQRRERAPEPEPEPESLLGADFTQRLTWITVSVAHHPAANAK